MRSRSDSGRAYRFGVALRARRFAHSLDDLREPGAAA
jgi:hypothetical protein